MISFSNQKSRDIRKPVRGCMGRMINLFDLSSGMSGTKLLTDKTHRDGLQTDRDCINDVQRESDSAIGAIKEKPAAHLPGRVFTNNKATGIPMKMLMAEELSKEREVVTKQPTVIAKLMGLDALPVQQSVPTVKIAALDRGVYNGYNSKKFAPPPQQRTSGGLSDRPKVVVPKQQHSLYPRVGQYQECKDVYEIQPQVPRAKNLEHAPHSRWKRTDCDVNNNKRMDLVRQKFTEAKHLATSQNLLQSKEFQDALEVLSSNRDLFLKFLEEPDSMLSQHLQQGQQQAQCNPTANNSSKRITLLRPMKISNDMSQDQKQNDLACETNRRIKDDSCQSWKVGVPKTGSLPQATRIVVLKPSPGKNRSATGRETSFPSTTTGVSKEPFPEGAINNEARDAREVAKEITRRMRENLSSNRRDENEALLSHILSKVSTDDDDSLNRSGKEHIIEECACCSTSSQVSPASQDSWKYSEAFGSPYSFPRRSHFPYLPESSVIREAKRRLSERWVSVTSSGVDPEPEDDIQRSSSTLGEMLSLREANKEESMDERFGLAARSGDGCRLSCHKNLQRSKSVPWSCSANEKVSLNAETVDLHQGYCGSTNEAVDKTEHGSLTFKGKVSSLMFSRSSKVSDIDKSYYSSYMDHVSHASSRESGNREVTAKNDHTSSPSQHRADQSPKEGPIFNYEKLLRKNLYSTENDSELGTPSKKESLPLEKLMAAEDANDDLEQPSPVSVLEAQFEDDIVSSKPSGHHSNVNQECNRASPRRLTTESVTCSLSWDDDDDILRSPNYSKTIDTKKSTEEEYLVFVRSLLSSSSLGDERSVASMTSWYSLDSPLDPALLHKFLTPKGEAARSRERRSNQRLLFDCVNNAILEMSRSSLLDSCSWPMSRPKASIGKSAVASVMEEVLAVLRSLLLASRKPSCSGLRSDEISSVIVDLIIRKEISGRGWEEMMKLEFADEVVVDIQGQVVDELVEETLLDCFC